MLACLGLGGRRLHFSADRTRLLDPRSPIQQSYERYRTGFAQHSELAIMIHASEAASAEVVVKWWVEQLQQMPEAKGVLGWLDLPKLPQQALFYADDLAALEARLDGPGPKELREALLRAVQSGGRAPYQSPLGPQPPDLPSRQYLKMSPHTWAVLARVEDPGYALLERLEKLDKHFAGVTWELAGDYVVFASDSRVAQRTALQVSLLSVILVHFFFRWSWGHPRPARQALLTVLVGLSWCCAWVAVRCPELNLVTVNFAATLIGLGMDFNVHMLYRYQSLRPQLSSQDALTQTLATVGFENLVGAAATSAAFLSLTLTPFVAVAQLGWISGIGVWLCWLASVTVLPCLMLLFPPPALPPPPAWEKLWWDRPRTVVALAALVTLLLGMRAQRPFFDGNLLNMMPLGCPAARIEERSLDWCSRSSLAVMARATSLEELRDKHRAFEKLPEVAKVESAYPWLARNSPQQVARIVAKAQTMPVPPHWPERLSKADLLRWKQQGQGLDLSGYGPGIIQDGLSSFLFPFGQDLQFRYRWLKGQKAEAPRWEDFPVELRERFSSPKGEWLIKVYARQSLWDPKTMTAFLSQLQQVDPEVTGLPVLTLEYLTQMQKSYWSAARNALLAIFLLLCLSLGGLRPALWALFPKLLGLVWMLGAMGWLGLNFNPANSTALPLTLGIGLVFGVHVLHHGAGKPVFQGPTGAAVMISGMSTMLGYISLVTSSYRGVASLGVVMALGVGSGLITSLVVLPAALRLSSSKDSSPS